MALEKAEFDAHPLWDVEKRISPLLRETESALEADALGDAQVLQSIRMALADVRAIGHIELWRISSTAASMEQLYAALNEVERIVNALKASPAASLKPSLVNVLDQLVLTTNAFPLYTVRGEAASETAQALKDQRTFLDETVTDFRQDIEKARVELTSLSGEIEAKKSQIAAQVSRLDSILNEQSSTFADKLSGWKNDSDVGAASLVESGQKYLDALTEMESQSRNLVDATSRHTITAQYGDYAKRQESAASFWSLGAVVAAVGAFAYLAFLLAFVHDVSVPETVLKATISSLVVVGAGYMGHEAAGHRRESRDARRLQLDLNALDPFLTKLDEREANDLRREFAQKIFGRPLANNRTQKPYEWVLGTFRRDKTKDEESEATV